MTPLERAARAIEDAIFNPAINASISIQCDDPQRVHKAIARAVLTAIREPSEKMLSQNRLLNGFFIDSDGLVDHEYLDPENVTMIWQDMIDAALEEG